MILAQHGILGIPDESLIPTDKTKIYAAIETLDENRYYLNSLLHQNPKDKNIIINTFSDGVDHVSDSAKKISYRKSTDRGLTYGAKTTVYDPTDSTYQIQDPGAGFDRNGRLHIFADCHTVVGSTGGSHELRYMYSDDNLSTISSPVTIAKPGSLGSFRMYGRMIDLGGVLLAPAYSATDEGVTTNSERYVLRSTDGGANWSWVLVETGTEYVNESEVLAITNNIVIMMSRLEVLKQYVMYKSTDRGATWVRVGYFGTTVGLTIAAPCRLHKFRADNGKYYAVMYFPDKNTGMIYAIYGRLDNGVDAGVGLFNVNTLTLLRDDSAALHYGDMCHYNGNMNCRGAWPRESGTFPFDNQLLLFENVTTQYDTVFALIDPVTIYDKLGYVEFIGAWRGLVSNTTNNWGIVDSSSRVTTWKGIAPGGTGAAKNAAATAGGILLGDGVEFDGTKALAFPTIATWNFMSYSSLGESDLNYTLHFKIKLGTSSNPNAFYGILGNYAGSASNKGAGFFYDDRVSVPRSDALGFSIAKGSAGFIIDFLNQNVITPNVWCVIQLEVDASQATQNNKVKLYVNGVLISTTVTTYNTGIVNTPSFTMQIGAVGNNVGIGVIKLKDVVIQNVIDLSGVRDNFYLALNDAS